MDPICQGEGCYMFGPDTPQRTACEQKCRLLRCRCGQSHNAHIGRRQPSACTEFTPVEPPPPPTPQRSPQMPPTPQMQSRWDKWVSTYLSQPNAEDPLEGALGFVNTLKRHPKTNTGALLATAGFVAQVWSAHPERVAEWTEAYLARLDESAGPDRKGRGFLYFVLAFGSDVSVALLDGFEPIDETDAHELASAQKMTFLDLEVLEVEQAYHLDLLWGCFFGSGNHQFLRQIMVCIPEYTNNRASVAARTLAKAAHWSWSSTVRENPSVQTAMALVYAELPDLQDQVQAVGEKMIHEATCLDKIVDSEPQASA